jgi:hypothetical protein
MEEILEARSIVLNGGWNTRILTPDWLDKKLFQMGELELQFPFDPTMPIIISDKDRMTLIVSNSRLILRPKTLSEELLIFIADSAEKLVSILPYTPLTAIGINFGFKETSLPESINTYLERTAQFGLSKISGIKNRTTITIKRSLLLSRNYDSRTLNFEITKTIDSHEVNFNFNYHKDISDTKKIKFLLKAEKAIKLHSYASDFLRKLIVEG